MNDYRDPRVRELERLKYALNKAAQHLDELDARLGDRSVEVKSENHCPGPADFPANGCANQIVLAMDRFRTADRSAR
jgi:hypothetical protein